MSAAGFVPDPFRPRRRRTTEVRIGDVGVGGGNPLRVQSMTTTDTLDTRATADQAERLAAAGCEIVRITAPGRNEAENLREIAAELRRRGVRAPLVADIHFAPAAALIAAEHVEKVRINPGNYADKKRFAVREYSEAEWAEEIERVAERFRPLVRRCRELGRALRIGTNHGSLSDRILNRFGDTPLGMVESALEFLAVCEDEGYRDVVFSMKASNAQVAIHAYRLLAARLAERSGGFDAASYPFHLGVTEAGDGEDGRIKSAIGIGALLEDGIGDTIRVSLTEDPVREIPVARALARRYDERWAQDAKRAASAAEPRAQRAEGERRPSRGPEARAGQGRAQPSEVGSWVADPYSHARRVTRALSLGSIELGATNPVRVELDLGPAPRDPHAAAAELARSLAAQRDVTLEGVGVGAGDAEGLLRAAAFAAALSREGVTAPVCLRVPPGLAGEAAGRGAARLAVPVLSTDDARGLAPTAAAANRAGLALEWMLVGDEPEPLVDLALAAGAERALFSVAAARPVHAARRLAARLAASGAADAPIVLRRANDAPGDPDAALLRVATDLGAPLCDGIGDSVVLSGFGDPGRSVALAYRILQGARLRTSWTEFISCPSCGRTLFDLEETTARIKSRTSHLKGVKIAIMGCIVNGPGEMADADFGYVGSGPGRVNLYVSKDLVERNIPSAEADDRLVELIRKHGRWVEPPPA